MSKTNASIAIQVLPNVSEQQELIRVVDAVIKNIQSKGLKYEVGAFETTIDGELDELIEIIRESALICINEGAPSVLSYIKLNYSEKGVMSIDQKTKKYKE